MKKKLEKTPTYWYKKVYSLCPVCGAEDIYKYRVYGQKPTKSEERLSFEYITNCCYD